MMASDPNYSHLDEKIHCDIFFSNRDVTALRWVSEINRLLAPYQDYVVINVHEVNSDHARKMQIFADSVVINNQRIEFYEVNKTLFELATEFVNELQEYSTLNIDSE